MGNIREKISQNIIKYRKKLGLSQKELAEKIGVKNLTTVSSWERGANSPDVETLSTLCDLFNISIDEMYGGKTALDNEVASAQGVIAVVAEIYGNVELIEDEQDGKGYSYWLVGFPPNQFILHEKDMDTIYEMTKSAIPPIVERMKDTRRIEDIVKGLLSENQGK